MLGFVFVLVGLALFLDGLETALFPIGRIMARQLTDPAMRDLSRAARQVEGMGFYDVRAALELMRILENDMIIMILRDRLGVTPEEMEKMHRNLE